MALWSLVFQRVRFLTLFFPCLTRVFSAREPFASLGLGFSLLHFLRILLLFLLRLWYNSYTLCDSISRSERAKAFVGIPSGESASRKYRRFSFILITATSVRIFPLSSAPSAHHLGEWPRGRLSPVIFEVREYAEGEF